MAISYSKYVLQSFGVPSSSFFFFPCIIYGLSVTFFLKVTRAVLGAWLGTYRCSKKAVWKNLMNNPLSKKFHNNGLPKLPVLFCFLFSYFCYCLFTWNLPQLLNPIQYMLFIPNLVKHSKCLILNNHISVWENFRFVIYQIAIYSFLNCSVMVFSSLFLICFECSLIWNYVYLKAMYILKLCNT